MADEQSSWDLKELSKPPAMRWVDKTSRIRSLIYEGPVYKGDQPTEVFAFYATPGTISGNAADDKNLPAVVLVHGGGGTAFCEWAWLWAQRGYAAIAMDLSGRQTGAPEFDKETGAFLPPKNHRKIKRTRLKRGGPEQGHGEKFRSVGGSKNDDWPYHAVSNVILAHSLIRSFDEVDANRTALTGISWGGYTTCITASVDTRFKAAVPIYGCGFLHEGESVQKPAIDNLTAEQRPEWVRLYDPSSHLKHCQVPIFFVNGTNDINYPLDSYKKSYDVVPGEKLLRIQVRMPHGHPPGWAPNEIGRFIDSYVKDGKPLPRLGLPEKANGQVTVKVTNGVKVAKAALNFATDKGKLAKRHWQSVDGAVNGDTITASMPPEGTTIWVVTVTDDHDGMTSTEIMFESDN